MSEKMRDEFEEAVATGAICDGFRHQMCSYIAFMKSIKDMRTKFGYADQVIDDAYKIWRASRAALVVELPANCKGMALTVDELRVALDNIGVTLK